MRLGPGHDGCVDDDESGAYFDRASTHGHDQVDREAQVKREETSKAGLGFDSNHVAPDAPG